MYLFVFDAVSRSDYKLRRGMAELLDNTELETTWEKAIVAKSEALIRHLAQEIQGNHEIGHSEIPVTRWRFELRISGTRKRSATHSVESEFGVR
jgi:hypothetical protein